MTWAGSVAPDFTAVAETGLYSVIGALLTVAIIVAVAMLVVCAVWWAVALHSASWHQAALARFGVLISLGGAALTGGTMAIANWLLILGVGL